MAQLTSQPRIAIAPVISATISIYRWAVYLSFAFLGVGFVAALFSEHTIHSEIGTPQEMLRHALDFHPEGFFGIGIGIMILAPIAMLFNAASILFRKGDRRYALYTVVVALILSISILIAFLRG
ncbi:MAG: DUF1634 domain-containing protein [Thermomicrobiales bacterium]|nr:DUF1634 domain-containing protein [Thermomicrobiales bacterium]MCO5226221.1 DUF1634 domain-containing protein [Thermomicrobiales bacterium]MCO5227392.1 DUF1634 domain-containing protein [Thermomicrobiales bacterium]